MTLADALLITQPLQAFTYRMGKKSWLNNITCNINFTNGVVSFRYNPVGKIRTKKCVTRIFYTIFAN